MSESVVRVVFTPTGLSAEVPEGTTVLDAARKLGVDLDSVCGGRGLCGRCQVEPSVGSFPKWDITATAEDLSPWGALEENYKGRRKIEGSRRLGCGARVLGDAVIDIPPESQLHRQVIRKDVDVGELTIDPVYTLHYVPDGAELAIALKEKWGLDHVQLGPAAEATGEITVAVKDGSAVSHLWPGFVERVVGMAVDIGSTTVAGHLCDLATGEILSSSGLMNPQIRFGEDLMSRVSYAMMNPGGVTEMTDAIHEALEGLLDELVTEADVPKEHVLDITLVGNPIMHHLALGLDPTPLGQAPFPLAIEGAYETAAVDIDIDVPSSSVYVGPCIAGHVGADTAAAILAEGPHRSDKIQLLVDVGTNAEIVLGNNERMFAASSPTGPAFEGAQISCGQRATTGAVERVRVDPDTLEPSFRIIGSELWSTDPGFAESIPSTGITGVCGSGIIEVISELVLAGVIDQKGVIVGEAAARSPRIVEFERVFSYVLHEDLHVTQADIRAIQLAKAALRAGIELLLEHAELTAVDEIRLAGAFGAHIDPHHAMVLGLIPEGPIDSVRSVGNAAGVGAIRSLLSVAERREMEETVKHVTKIETAIEPRFQELFVEALAFPRSTVKAQAPGRRRRRGASQKES